MIAEVFALIGALLILVSALGVIRFRDVMVQMHLLSKATTLGIVVLLFGAALGVSDLFGSTSLVLAAFLQMLTSPVSANLISHSTYLRQRRNAAEQSAAPPDAHS
ncbi:MAG: monovalent cation/H(+) antiporter subunit G [Actinobacteria bacterium]|nr:monovalent cation/H(+) antiporter subunit G [Actinomycetota bacterium]